MYHLKLNCQIHNNSKDTLKLEMLSSIESQDYQLVEKVVTDGGIPVTRYVNRITGKCLAEL